MNKMSFNNHTILTGLVFAALLGSCKKLIGIPANPPSEITEVQQFADSATVLTAVAGVYNYGAYSQGFAYNDSRLTILTGESSDEILPTFTYDPETIQFYQNNIKDINSYAATLWGSPYRGLYPVNATLQGVAGNPALSPTFVKQITGEMKVVRALYNFNLVNLFGAVPIINTTNYRTAAVIGRSSTDSVYGQIVGDLTDAVQDLGVAYPSDGHYRPNVYTASALLSKVYLYRGKWQEAYDAADAVIGSGQYSLDADLNNVFIDGSSEAIWELPAAGSYNVTAEAQNFVPQSDGTVPNYPLTTFLVNAFEPNDKRLQDWAGQVTVDINGTDQVFYYPYKYKQVRPASPVESYVILRLAELYLIRAEAAAHLGNVSVALDDLNLVRDRAGLPASGASSADAVLSAIMHERQTEMFCEWGSRWYDLKRTGTADAVLGAEKPGWDTHDALYPIPRVQLQVNALLRQNPGY